MLEEAKPCPFCSGEIKIAAIKCKHCGNMLNDAGKQIKATSVSPPLVQPTKQIFIYKIVLRKITNHKAYYEFWEKLKSVMKVPPVELKNYVIPGKVIQSFNDKASAERALKALKVRDVELE